MTHFWERQEAMTPGRLLKPLLIPEGARDREELPLLSPVSPIFRALHRRKSAQMRLSPKRNNSLSLLFPRKQMNPRFSPRPAAKETPSREESACFQRKFPLTPTYKSNRVLKDGRKSLQQPSLSKFPRSVFSCRRRLGL